jgi:hypothetical protein
MPLLIVSFYCFLSLRNDGGGDVGLGYMCPELDGSFGGNDTPSLLSTSLVYPIQPLFLALALTYLTALLFITTIPRLLTQFERWSLSVHS